MPSDARLLQLPSPRAVVEHALPNLIEGVAGPLLVFWLTLKFVGSTGAMIASLGWGVAVAARHLLRGRTVPGLIVLSLAALIARTAVSISSGSVFLYFLQPTLGTMVLAAAFLVSVALKRPLAERLTRDLVPVPLEWFGESWLQRFFARVSMLWAAVFLSNGLLSLYFLLTESVETYLWTRTAVSVGLTVLGILASTIAFVRIAGRHGVQVAIGTLHLGRRPVR